MAKSKYQESCTVNIEGFVNVDDMTIEVEDVGVKEISDILKRFNGANVKMSIKLSSDLD